MREAEYSGLRERYQQKQKLKRQYRKVVGSINSGPGWLVFKSQAH